MIIIPTWREWGIGAAIVIGGMALVKPFCWFCLWAGGAL